MPKRPGNRGSGVSDVKGVVRALIANREAGDSPVLANGGKAVAAAGQNFVAISLVADIPHDLVAWRVKQVMKRDGQLHRAQAGGQMAADLRDHGDHVIAQLLGDDGKILAGNLLQIGRGIDVVQITIFHVHLCQMQ